MKKSIKLMAALVFSVAAVITAVPVHGASTMIKGDLNRDDIVSIRDIVILKNHILGKYGLNDAQTIAADVNGDCTVDSLDLVAIQDMILQGMDKVPVGTWIGDCCGGKRYIFFDGGAVTVTDPTAGTTDIYELDITGELVVFRDKNSGSELTAFITWTDELSFVLKWENGSAESLLSISDLSAASSLSPISERVFSV